VVSRGLHSRGQLVGRTFVIGRGVPFPQVPDDAQPLTPVFLMATAGMRRIDPDKADAVLEAWYGGEEGGNAVAEAIFGDYSPAGKWCIRVALAAVG